MVEKSSVFIGLALLFVIFPLIPVGNRASAEADADLRTLIENLRTLKSDPNHLQQVEDRISEKEAQVQSEIESLEKSIRELQDSISESESHQKELARLLETLQPKPDGLAKAHGGVEGEALAEDWWAIQPLVRPEIPTVQNDRWSRNPIDRFVFRRLADKGLTPAPEADRVQLVRRLFFDLVGMPPTPREIDDFLNDSSPEAWEHLVDRLLDDPRYGEHWARFWLDLVRYAESDGWNKDSYRPNIWRYRDYVVDSFNRDKPYPQFVREQLAGDEMPGDDPEKIIATGFLRLGIYEYNQRDARNHWNDIMNEMTDVTGDVFLGVSMSCSRCHNHKFDPITQKDYFGLRAFFEPVIWRDDVPGVTEAGHEKWRKQQKKWEDATTSIRAEIDALCLPYYDRKWKETVDKFPLDIQACFNKPVEERTSWEHQMAYLIERQFYEEGTPALKKMTEEDQKKLEGLEKQLSEFDHLKPPPLPEVMSVRDFSGEISPTIIPKDRRHQPVPPHFLTVLASETPDTEDLQPELPKSTGRRTALAKWIGREDNPLTTRLIVNRIWQQHFGRGIVPTASDFGHLGEPPTHPKLLDWLTFHFVENGWSMKHLHKMILMSSTWKQSSQHPEASDQLKTDPSEDLLWRARIHRLSAEEIRDSMLFVSGELDRRIGGPSVDDKSPRRGLYMKIRRNSPDPLLSAFDCANGLKSVAQRNVTTTPTQALLLFNGDYSLGRAEKLADRIQGLETGDLGEALSSAFRLAWGRTPSEVELKRALAFVSPGTDQEKSTLNRERLVDFCHVLLNSNEFLYVD
ncbi:MAG: DUF1549 domain-containing protein [Candidatus Omnitrophica bacterium]|nr:DUF1549 domain-containing protein [Candidatus Omnitrophota bacterium]